MQVPYEPIRVTDGIPEYWRHDVEDLGKPELFGVWDYIVIESHEKQYALEWKDEYNLITSGTNIHRYDRIQRFTFTLYQFIGRTRVIIPSIVINTIKDCGFDGDPKKVWNSIWKILKRNEWKKFYNRIPCILKLLDYPNRIKFTETMIFNIQSDFRNINTKFDLLPKKPPTALMRYTKEKRQFIIETYNTTNTKEIKLIAKGMWETLNETYKERFNIESSTALNIYNINKKIDVEYFPSMRYVVLTLMEKNGFEFGFDIPRTRVKKIEDKLDSLLKILV